jgi:hypothetical protein
MGGSFSSSGSSANANPGRGELRLTKPMHWSWFLNNRSRKRRQCLHSFLVLAASIN